MPAPTALHSIVLDERPGFERTLLRAAALGAAVAFVTVVGTFLHGAPRPPPPVAVLALACCVLVLDARALRVGERLALLAAASVTSVLLPGPWAVAGFVGTLGVALAAGRPSARARVLAVVAAAGGSVWFLAVTSALLPHPSAPPSLGAALSLAALFTPGVFVGLALLPAHLAGPTESLTLRLRRLAADSAADPLGEHALDLWRRLLAALARLPHGAEHTQLLHRSRQLAEDVLTRAAELTAARATLDALDLPTAHQASASLRQRAETAHDAVRREVLARAAAVQSDALEQVASLERSRDRFEAFFELAVSRLERAALAVELTSIRPEALREVVRRLGEDEEGHRPERSACRATL